MSFKRKYTLNSSYALNDYYQVIVNIINTKSVYNAMHDTVLYCNVICIISKSTNTEMTEN